MVDNGRMRTCSALQAEHPWKTASSARVASAAEWADQLREFQMFQTWFTWWAWRLGRSCMEQLLTTNLSTPSYWLQTQVLFQRASFSTPDHLICLKKTPILIWSPSHKELCSSPKTSDWSWLVFVASRSSDINVTMAAMATKKQVHLDILGYLQPGNHHGQVTTVYDWGILRIEDYWRSSTEGERGCHRFYLQLAQVANHLKNSDTEQHRWRIDNTWGLGLPDSWEDWWELVRSGEKWWELVRIGHVISSFLTGW